MKTAQELQENLNKVAKELTEYQKFVQKKFKEKGIDEKNEMGKIPEIMKEVDKEWKAKDEKTASGETFKCPECDSKVLEQTKYCLKCKKKVEMK